MYFLFDGFVIEKFVNYFGVFFCILGMVGVFCVKKKNLMWFKCVYYVIDFLIKYFFFLWLGFLFLFKREKWKSFGNEIKLNIMFG